MEQRTNFSPITLFSLVAFLIMVLVFAAPAGAAPRFSASNNDQQVLVGIGDQVDIVLRTDPNTGFAWRPVRDENGMLHYSGRTFQRTALSGEGMHTLSFVVGRSGVTTLHLVYARPQEGAGAPRQMYTLRIEAIRTWNDAGAR